MTVKSMLCALTLFAPCAALHAQPLTLPTPQEAKMAILTMMNILEYKDQSTVKLGTCIPVVKQAGRVACTVAVKIGAGTSETQADFWRERNGRWKADASTSQNQLPFPDPKLR